MNFGKIFAFQHLSLSRSFGLFFSQPKSGDGIYVYFFFTLRTALPRGGVTEFLLPLAHIAIAPAVLQAPKVRNVFVCLLEGIVGYCEYIVCFQFMFVWTIFLCVIEKFFFWNEG